MDNLDTSLIVERVYPINKMNPLRDMYLFLELQKSIYKKQVVLESGKFSYALKRKFENPQN